MSVGSVYSTEGIKVRFDVEGVVNVDAGLDDDVEDSGYAQRLATVEDLSFFFGGIECARHETRNMDDEGRSMFPLMIYCGNALLCKDVIHSSKQQSSQIVLGDQ